MLTALRLYLRDAVETLSAGAVRVAECARTGSPRAKSSTALPGYTHMQQAMPSSVPLWAGGFAAEIRDDAEGLRLAQRRLGEESARLGRGLRHARAAASIATATREKLGFAATHEPVTAVQLSRGKAEAQVLFEIALLMQDLGRFAADVLLFYTQEFAFLELPDAFTTGSSIMPQKRNPDVFELIRGRSATAQACLSEALGHLREAALGLPARSAVAEGAAVPRHRHRLADARHPAARHRRDEVPAARASSSILRSMPRKKRTRWW